MPYSAGTLAAIGEYRAQGYRAARNGHPITANPYQGKLAREMWEKGFREFEKQVREARK